LGFLGGGARFPTLLFTPEAVRKRLPGLLAEGLLGGVVVWDRTVDDRELVRRIARGAEARGARILERAAASYGPRTPDGRIPVRVLAGGSEQTFFARSLVDASGPWVDRVRASAGERDADWLVPVAGSHIELKKFLPASMLLEAEDGRFFFVVNAGERARVGTTERPSDDPDAVAPTEEEIAYLLRSLRHYFPGVPAARSDVLAADAGIRPLACPSRETRANEISREHELRTSPSGALHLIGVKLTDHRRAAAEAVDRIVRDLGRPGVPRRTLTDKVPF
jgi:glycerol-3-phosphate dehydrogenase